MSNKAMLYSFLHFTQGKTRLSPHFYFVSSEKSRTFATELKKH